VYGYAVNVAGETGICSLPDLAQRHIVGGFIQWCITEREVKGQTLQRNLRLLDGVLRQFPRYKDRDFSWFKPLLDGIPVESDAVLQKRRAERVLEYAVLEKIPEMIRVDRPKAAKKGLHKLALLGRDELMIRWLCGLAWRQRNLRECRIGGPKPNLFKGPVPAITTIDLPPWAVEARKENPNAEFWQFHFSEDETKTGCTVDALVPRQLVEPLEEYLNTDRPGLLRGNDPGTLFLNQDGKPMSLNQVTKVVSTNTLRYGGRRVTPHKFRDSVAMAWLKEQPQNHLRLSKLLWHANTNEVIKTYGSLFNESSGVCSMEAWLEERAARRMVFEFPPISSTPRSRPL
jgi:integrase